MHLKSEGEAIGKVGYGIKVINPTHKLGSIGWPVSLAYRGQGYATEAARAVLGFQFEHLGIHRVHARTGRANERPWKLMERLGMRREAHSV